jgi:hypothetical protein
MDDRIPGISQHDAVRVFQKIGFRIKRQGKHIILAKGRDLLVIPRHNPIDACASVCSELGTIVGAAGMINRRAEGEAGDEPARRRRSWSSWWRCGPGKMAAPRPRPGGGA